MGLDAVVYKNREVVDLGRHACHARVVPETGEIYFDEQQLYHDYPKRYFEAVSFRIGNVSAVAELLEEVRKLAGSDSFIETRVLYSGSHSGDTIAVEELAELEREVEVLSAPKLSKSSWLAEFLSQLRALIRAAQINRNPIVFI
jgi:hypothetical protein